MVKEIAEIFNGDRASKYPFILSPQPPLFAMTNMAAFQMILLLTT